MEKNKTICGPHSHRRKRMLHSQAVRSNKETAGVFMDVPSKWEDSRQDLVDIREISIQEEGSKEEKMADFLAQIKNPYRFRWGDWVVESVFADTDQTLEDRLIQYFQRL